MARSYGEEQQSGDDEERQHFLDCCWSLVKYQEDAMHEVRQLEESIKILDENDRALWQAAQAGTSRWIQEVCWRVRVNAQFLGEMPTPEVCGADLGPNEHSIVKQVPDHHRVASRNASKVRTTLRQFVRDWAVEGKEERAACYAPLIEALMKRLPPGGKGGGKGQGKNGWHRVLCPGCGLGRLPFDLACLGYDAQGNEFSYHMLLGGQLILNKCSDANMFTIYPYVLSTTNRRQTNDHLREVKIPEISPRKSLRGGGALSMAAGEFVEVYKDQDGEWDSVLTAFFLDTAKNVFLYIRTIAMLIREGGLWINFGPLLYHYAEMDNEISIELSWEEIRPTVLRYFTISEEEVRPARYTKNPGSLVSVKYKCIFFVATRNAETVRGRSRPVYP
jgi:hypothetical protein